MVQVHLVNSPFLRRGPRTRRRDGYGRLQVGVLQYTQIAVLDAYSRLLVSCNMNLPRRIHVSIIRRIIDDSHRKKYPPTESVLPSRHTRLVSELSTL